MNYTLSENEFEKYLTCLDLAAKAIEEEDYRSAECWLQVAKMALKQAAAYRQKKL